MTKLADEYGCASCGGTFKKTWSDEEAVEEFKKTFGREVLESDDIVCDDCYTKFMEEV